MVFFFQAEDGIRDGHVTGVQTCALPILRKADRVAGAEDKKQRRRKKIVKILQPGVGCGHVGASIPCTGPGGSGDPCRAGAAGCRTALWLRESAWRSPPATNGCEH